MNQFDYKIHGDEELRKKIAMLERQNEILKSQLMNTSLINELTGVMHTSTDPESIIRTILLGIQELTDFDRIVLFGIEKERFALRPQSWVGIDGDKLVGMEIPLGFEGGEITDAIFLNRHIIIEEPDEQMDPFYSRLHSKGYLVIPLVSKITRKCWEEKSCKKLSCPVHGGANPYCWSFCGSGDSAAQSENDRRRRCLECSNFKVEGVFWMDQTIRQTGITSDCVTILTTILNQAGVIIENFRIFSALESAYNELQLTNNQLKIVNHDLRIAQTKINRDLEHARTIQQGLLPENISLTDGLRLGATYIPAEAVGGDYYDVFQISPHTYGVVVADVSGHGVASALIMTMVKILLKTYASRELGPQETLEKINQTFISEIKTDNFVTIFYGILNTSTHTLQYTSAGHCPMLLIDKRSGENYLIKADGLFLGVFPDMMLNQTSQSYEPDSLRIFLYTDGLTEAKNGEGEMFDMKRLEQAARQTLSSAPAEALRRILSIHKKFCGKERATDDITLLVVDI
ncbi:MAG: GAF domain-containing SpoIIE family protein phosphatase [Fibrobacterota bacterium]